MLSELRAMGPQLKRLRSRRGLSTYDVEKAIGINASHLSALENGRSTNPTIQLLGKLATLYGVPLESLVSNRTRAQPSAEGARLLDKFETQLSPKAKDLVLALADELAENSKHRNRAHNSS